jgi:MFS family permease
VIGLHVVTGEIYPTQFRSTAAGWAITIGRIGGIVGPVLGGVLQMAGFTFEQFFVIFAVPSFICALLVFFFRVNVKGESVEIVAARLAGTISSAGE